MKDREPTIRSRELGEALRTAMHNAGYNGSQVARQLGWSPSRVSRLLSGKRGGRETDIASFLTACKVKNKELERLLELCRDQNVIGWLQQHGSHLPKQLRTLIDHENIARTISAFELTVMPGLMQTPDYAKAVISRIVNVPANEVDDRVQARLARQGMFTKDRQPTFCFYLHQFALELPVGTSHVMSAQLHHLLRMSVRPHVTVRVIPKAVGAHPALSGPFRLTEFKNFRPVVYLESETSSLFLAEPQEIQAYRNILAGLAEIALDQEQSRDLIVRVAQELYADREDQHDPA